MLTQDRDTPRREGTFLTLPIAADTQIFAGAMVAVDTSGRAVPAEDDADLVVVGRSEVHVDNSGGAAGAKIVKVRRGVFRFDNDETLPVEASGVFGDCYVEDDGTVRRLGAEEDPGEASRAGLVLEVEQAGVWVEINSLSRDVLTALVAEEE